MGAHGYTAQSLSSFLRSLGLKQQLLRTCLAEVGDEALRTPFHIWVLRDSFNWCKIGHPEKDKLTSKVDDLKRSESKTNVSEVGRDSDEASSVLRSEAIVPTVECSPAPIEPRNLRPRGKLPIRTASQKKGSFSFSKTMWTAKLRKHLLSE